MLRFYQMLFLAGIIALAGPAFAGAQNPSGLPNTPPSGTPGTGSSATSGGHGSSDVSSATNPTAAGSSNTGAAASSTTTTNPPASAATDKTSTVSAPATNSVSTPPMPTTTILPGANGDKDPTDVTDLLAPGQLPREKLSLIGGIVRKIDHVRDHMDLKIYGADTLRIAFDQRTRFFRDGREVTQMTIKPGDRVYLDTQLDQNRHVFAKNVHVQTTSSPADASGQILSYNPRNGDMLIQDDLSSKPVRFRVAPSTNVTGQEGEKNPSRFARNDLRPGALVAVKFSPRQDGGAVAEQVSIIAEPGSSFTFFGRIMNLDLKNNTLAIQNQTDGKTYDLYFDSARTPIPDNLIVGSDATIVATFEGKGYLAQNITVSANQEAESETPKQ